MAKPRKRTVAVVLCAGQGTRLGADLNKVLVPLVGKPMVVHALETFEQARVIDDVVLVTHPLEGPIFAQEIVARYALAKVRAILPGGATRHQSEMNALTALRARIERGE